MRYILFGTFFILLECAALAGILRPWGQPLMPAAFNIGMPAFFLFLGLWKVDRRERWGIAALAITFFIVLNRATLGLGFWAVPLVFAGAGYLIYFGLSHLGEWRPQLVWVLLSLLVTVVIFAGIVFAIPFLLS